MPIKTDETGKRWVEMAFIAPGTPEQIWHAMATGAGNSTWFTRAQIEERVGGELRFEFGPEMSSSGEVTAWQPPHRLGYVERDWSPGAPPVATEITIASRGANKCVVRMVHSLFSTSDEWDDQMEGFEGGWPGYFEVLRIYLTHFAGMPGATFQAMVTIEDEPLAVWKQIVEGLGLAGANVGETRTIPGPTEPLSVVIERTQQDATLRYVAVRIESPEPGAAIAGTYRTREGVMASVSMFHYGERAEAVAQAGAVTWREWLEQGLVVRK
jgi:uncharacterized protein YndB with AHSA1/START domain